MKACDDFMLLDEHVKKLETLVGVKFSCLIAPFTNTESIYASITHPLSTFGNKNLEGIEGSHVLAVLPSHAIARVWCLLEDVLARDPTTSLTVVVARDKGAHFVHSWSSWLRVSAFSKGHPIATSVEGRVVTRRSTRELRVFHKAPSRDTQLNSYGPLGLTMEFEGRLAGEPANVLLDTGAGSSFVSARFARDKGIALTAASGSVRVGDDRCAPIVGVATLKLRIQGYSGSMEFNVVDLIRGVDVVLGNTWLKKHGVLLDFGNDTASVRKGHKALTLYPCMRGPRVPATHAPLTAMQVKRMARKGQTIFLGVLEKLVPPEGKELPEEVKGLLEEFADVFQAPPAGLPPKRNVGHTIPLEPGAIPPFRPMYRLSPAEYAEAKRQIADYLEKGWIEPSSSPYGAPILFVSKKDGTLRMCVDYRAINKVTVRNRYPLPRTEDLFDQLQGAKYFTSLDLTQGYHQLRITPEDVPKTAFRTPFGHFQFRVLSFGLTNAPATFQAAMNDVFRSMLGKHVLVYLDDILIFSKTLDEHQRHLREVLEILRRERFYAKLSKCTFCSAELEYLGHLVGEHGIKVDPRKVAGVVEWPPPTDVSRLRSFLGLANYFRRFIQGYSSMVQPLTTLTSKTKPWVWSGRCQQAFESVKHALVHAPVLTLPDPALPYEVICDASIVRLGAVLLQNGKPIAFESRKLSSAETRYTTTEQELLAVVHAMRTWRCYLEGCVGCTVITDHCPLTFFETQPNLSRRQARWSEYLSRFRFSWVYRPGRSNVADPLSRNPVRSALLTFLLAKTRAAGAAADAPGQSTTGACGTETSISTPSSSEWPAFYTRIRAGYVEDPWFQDSRNLSLLRGESGLWWKENAVVVPAIPSLRKDILREFHDTPWSGHLGPRKTLKAVREVYWWDGLSTDVESYCVACDPCARNKPSNQKNAGLLQPLPIPSQPWEAISMDFMVGLPETKSGYTAILVFVDRFTKMSHFIPTHDTVDAEGTAYLFIRWVYSLHGLPRHIVSDRDSRFTSTLWRELMQTLQTRVGLSTAFHPQTDGQTERMNRTIEQMLRMFVNSAHDDWDVFLPMVEFAYNNASQDSTGETPFVLNTGQHPLTPARRRGEGRSQGPSSKTLRVRMQSLHEEARKCLLGAQARQKAYADKGRREQVFGVGQKVLLSTKFLTLQVPGAKKLWPRWIGPYEIIAQVGPVAYKLRLPANMKCHDVFHVSLLAEYKATGTVQPPPPELLSDQLEYQVDRVLQHRERKTGRRVKREYLISWEGYGPDHNTWEPESHLSKASLDEYWEEQAARAQKRVARGVTPTRRPRKRQKT